MSSYFIKKFIEINYHNLISVKDESLYLRHFNFILNAMQTLWQNCSYNSLQLELFYDISLFHLFDIKYNNNVMHYLPEFVAIS